MLQTDGSWAIACKETATKPSQLSKSLMEPVRARARARAGVRARVRLRAFAYVCERLRVFVIVRACVIDRERCGVVCVCVRLCVCGGGWGGRRLR